MAGRDERPTLRRPSRSPRERDNGRLLALSDGVFAIAITLLVLDLKVPDPRSVAPGTLIDALADDWERLQLYALTFVIVGVFWSAHHRTFELISGYDTPLLWCNLLFLFWVSFLPFPTSLLGEFGGERASVIVYGASLTATSLSLTLLWWYAAHDRRLAHDDVAPSIARSMALRGVVMPAVFVVSVGLSFVSLRLAALAWLLTLALQQAVIRLPLPRADAD